MWEKKKGLVFIVSGPSGSGKSTLCKRVLSRQSDFYFSVSCTTRQKRKGEVEGKDYFFLSKDGFQQKIDEGQFLEYCDVYGNFYGTLRTQVLDKIKQGINVIIDIDVQGALKIKKSVSNTLLEIFFTYILIVPPSIKSLQERLQKRGTDTQETIVKRLSYAEKEISQFEQYDYLIVNNQLEEAHHKLDLLINAQYNKSNLFILE